MPIISVYISDETLKRLCVFAAAEGREQNVRELAEAAVEEAAMQAVPCINGKPIDERFRPYWTAYK